MARHSANSLKGKILLATSMLAFFTCTFGIGSYLVVSLFADNSLYSVLIRFLLIALAVMVFGWWLSNEVVSPIERVSLLAKSLERGVSTSLPKTSGSSETDELLQSLHRNNQQLQNLVGLMDKVSSGNLDVTLTPLEQSDRLTSSFQKLLGKVTESINAKRDLERLKDSIRKIEEETSRVKNGNLDVEIKFDSAQTKEISETLKFLIDELNEMVAYVRNESKQTQTSAIKIQKTIQTAIGADEIRTRETNQATITLKKIPQLSRQISEELSASASAASQSIERARTGSQTAHANLSAISDLRGQMQEAVKRIGKLTERSQEIGKVAKTVEDLAQRTNMIALNASIQAVEPEVQKRGILILAEEIERLAERAEKANKQISALNKSIVADISEVEHSLQTTGGEAALLVNFGIETRDSLGEIEKYLGQFLNLQTKLVSTSTEQSAEADAAFETFVASLSENETSIKNLKEFEADILSLSGLVENLLSATSDFKVLEDDSEKSPGPYSGALKTVDPKFSA
jgi:methyl-accepting chemotaxis protein